MVDKLTENNDINIAMWNIKVIVSKKINRLSLIDEEDVIVKMIT